MWVTCIHLNSFTTEQFAHRCRFNEWQPSERLGEKRRWRCRVEKRQNIRLRSIKVSICSLKNNPHYCRGGVKVLHVSERQMTKRERGREEEKLNQRTVWSAAGSCSDTVPVVPNLFECLWVHACLCPCISTTYYSGHTVALVHAHFTIAVHYCWAGDTSIMSTQSWAHSKSLSFL